MTPDQLMDEAARPRAPDFPELTPAQAAHGAHLAAIHDLYRAELAQVADLLARIRAGGAGPAALADALDGSRMARNLALFGTVCGRQCALLKNHHDIEERWMFPAIAEHASPGVQRVLDRLIAEHRLIHDLIRALHRAATALARDPTPGHLDACAAGFADLDRAIRSHFGYEETQLQAPLGAYGIPI